MSFIKNDTPLHGCFELLPKVHRDERGTFVKIFHAPAFKKLGLGVSFTEEYYSVSGKGALRGLHFQTPPAALVKLVCCLAGEVLDAVLDLRKKSPTCGKHFTLKLKAEKGNMLYIPKGCAHGFYSLSAKALVLYKTSAVYAPENDAGLLWNSAGINWPCKKPLISPRDVAFPALRDFKSPF